MTLMEGDVHRWRGVYRGNCICVSDPPQLVTPENKLAVDSLDRGFDNSLVPTFDFVCAEPLKVVAKAGEVEEAGKHVRDPVVGDAVVEQLLNVLPSAASPVIAGFAEGVQGLYEFRSRLIRQADFFVELAGFEMRVPIENLIDAFYP